MNLRVLTFNVWALMPPFAADLMPRMRAIGAALPALGLDVAALQEVWDRDARASLIEAGQRAGLAHAWYREGGHSGSGLLVLSRHPIERPHFEAFELGGWPEAVAHADYWGGKGCVELTLATDAGEVRLFDTHLHAAYTERGHDPYIGHRIGQVLQLAERINATTLPVVALGDFNFEERFDEYAILTGLTAVSDVARTLDRREPTVLRSNPYRGLDGTPDERIDYVFARSGERARIAATDIARAFDETFESDGRTMAFSDHAGLIAEFQLRHAASPPPARAAATLALARSKLANARADAAERRGAQRGAGAAAALACVAAWLASGREAVTRRVYLRTLVTAGAVGAGLLGAGELTRAERFRVQELAAFDAALARIERLRAALSPSASGADPAASPGSSRR